MKTQQQTAASHARPTFQEISRVRRSWSPAETADYVGALPIWNGAPKVEQKFGGLQNRTYFVTEPDGKRYAVRVGFDQFRTRQTSVVNCTIAAQRLGLGPRLVYAEPNLSVVEFVEGRQMTPEEMADRKNIALIVDTLKKLHEGGAQALDESISYWWPFDSVRRYLNAIEQGKEANGWQPSPWAHLVPRFREITDRLEKVIGPYTPKLTHNDVVCVNMIWNRQGELQFIDWDGGAYGHPLFDIGEMLMWVEADDDLVRYALTRYYGELGESEMSQRVKEIRAFQIMAGLRLCTESMEHLLDPHFYLTPDEVAEGIKANLPGADPSLNALIELLLPRFEALWGMLEDMF